jgi:hypothetical protein
MSCLPVILILCFLYFAYIQDKDAYGDYLQVLLFLLTDLN